MDPIPEGAISHHIGFDADGLIGFDVWETEAQMKAFHEERVSPGLLRVGLPADPPMVVTLHALWTAADAPRHNVFVPAPKIETT